VELHGIATDISVILVARSGENAVITTRAAAAALTAAHADRALASARPGDLVVMQGNLDERTTRDTLKSAKARGLRTAMNPSPMQSFAGSLLDLVDSVFVNEGEARMLGGVEAIMSAGAGEVVLTLGSRGAALIRHGGRVDVAAHPCSVVDTTGAGDCFMGVALASAALRGVNLDAAALRHGARAAAYTVARAGTVSAFPDRAIMRDILAST
jgi:ribokinase